MIKSDARMLSFHQSLSCFDVFFLTTYLSRRPLLDENFWSTHLFHVNLRHIIFFNGPFPFYVRFLLVGILSSCEGLLMSLMF